jgi:hypothetical protein
MYMYALQERFPGFRGALGFEFFRYFVFNVQET